MRHQRSIIIRDPKLQNIRNNLRLLIIRAVSKQVQILIEEISKMPSLEEREKSRALRRKIKSLRIALDQSICICPTWKSYEKDMVYFPLFGSWVCLDCFNFLP